MTRNGPSLLIVCVLVSFANASLTSFNLESRSQIYPVKLESGAFNVGLRGASPNLALRGGNLQIGTGYTISPSCLPFTIQGVQIPRIFYLRGNREMLATNVQSFSHP